MIGEKYSTIAFGKKILGYLFYNLFIHVAIDMGYPKTFS
jgi:hypothetical protein